MASTLHTKTAVLITVAAVVKKYGKFYSYASQKKLLELLKEHHGIIIGRRQLNYHLGDLEQAGLIKRQRRNHRKTDGTLCLLSTAICITIKGANRLWKIGIEWGKRHLQRLKGRYAKPKHPQTAKPWKSPPIFSPKPPPRRRNNPFLDPLPQN